jgi:hypothetical protein
MRIASRATDGSRTVPSGPGRDHSLRPCLGGQIAESCADSYRVRITLWANIAGVMRPSGGFSTQAVDLLYEPLDTLVTLV